MNVVRLVLLCACFAGFWTVSIQSLQCSTEGILKENSGIIQASGHFKKTHCEWRIIGKPGKLIRLQFKAFEVNYNIMCNYDKLLIYEVKGRTKNLKRTMCGYNTRPEDLLVEDGTSIIINLIKNDNSKYCNIRIKYDVISPNQVPPEMASGSTYHCLNTGNLHATAKDKFIYSHQGFGSHKYFTFMRCMWRILGRQGKKIRLHFNSFNVETDNCKKCDSLTIYNNFISPDKIIWNKTIWRKQGYRPPKPLYSEVGKGFSLVFTTDGTEDYKGFNISYGWCPCNQRASTQCREPCNCSSETYHGKYCDICDDKYYIDESGLCKQCDCLIPDAQKGNLCNKTTGQCACKAGYSGFKCDQCAKTYFRNKSNMTCEPSKGRTRQKSPQINIFIIIGIILAGVLLFILLGFAAWSYWRKT